MDNILTVHENDEPIYDIFFANDFNSLPELLAGQGIADKRVCIVTETTVAPLYLDAVKEQLKGKCKELISIIFKAGEENKNLDTVKYIYEELIRGIDFIQIPTTLLSQVDSSIGGKTGVDFDSYKNMVGAFHMPKLVYINISTIKTLNDTQFISGMGEIIKHGLIKDEEYFDWMISNAEAIQERVPDKLLHMIKVSCNIKRMVVENDPTEKGERALLNFGHTLGHAIEKYMNFTMSHGACVGIGCILAAYISYKKNCIDMNQYHSIVEAFKTFGFDLLPADIDVNEIVRYTKNDKKMVGDSIKFILLHSIGNAYIDMNVSEADMIAALNEAVSK